jgi:hypothetical protein
MLNYSSFTEILKLSYPPTVGGEHGGFSSCFTSFLTFMAIKTLFIMLKASSFQNLNLTK